VLGDRTLSVIILALLLLPAAAPAANGSPRAAAYSVVYAQGVGNYTDYEVHSPCGMTNSTDKISWDQPEKFADQARVTAQQLWFGYGFVEYTYHQNVTSDNRILSLCLTAELASEASGYNFNYPSDITVSFGGKEVCMWTSPGDPGGRRGKYAGEFWSPTYSNWGYLKQFQTNTTGTYIDGTLKGDLSIYDLALNAAMDLTVRLAVKSTASHRGGLNLYGATAGDYPYDLMLDVTYEPVEGPPPPPPPGRGVSLEPAPSENATGKNISHPVEAGQATLFALVLRNTGEAADDIALSAGPLVDGWACVLGSTFHLAAGEARNLSVRLDAAGSLYGGDAVTFDVTATSKNDSSVRDAVHLNAVIPVHAGFELWCDEPVLPVDAGSTVSFVLNAQNTGNVDETCKLELVPEMPGWDATIQFSSLTVQRGRTTAFFVNVTAAPTLRADDTKTFAVLGNTTRAPADGSPVRLKAIVNPSYFIRAQSGSLVERVFPGGTAAFDIALENVGNTNDTAFIGLSAPEPAGWTVSTFPPSIHLAYLGRSPFTVNVTAPEHAGPDERWTGHLDIRSAGNSSNTWSVRLTVIVLELRGWSANVTPGRQAIPPGAGAGWNVTLVNRGNLPRAFMIDFMIPGGLLSHTIAPRNVTVPPFEDRTEHQAVLISTRGFPGARTVTVRVSVEKAEAVFNVTIEVLQVYRVELRLADERHSSPAGVSLPVKLTVLNGGNGVDICELRLDVVGLDCGCGRMMALEPFSSENITVMLRVPPESYARVYRLDALIVSSGGPRDSRQALLSVTERPPYTGNLSLLVMLLIGLLSAISTAAHERVSRPVAQEKT